VPKLTPTGVIEKFKDFCPDACDEIPLNMPEALGGQARTACFVDANHAGDKPARRSCTGIIVKINNAIVFTFSKQQTTVLVSVPITHCTPSFFADYVSS
jgi:hypothetical protein